MQTKSKNKVSNLLRREAERRGATVLPYAPEEIYIDPCNACDLRCTFCPQSNWGSRKRGLMSEELFLKAIEEAASLRPRRINLFCYGESLLHKKISDMVRLATDKGLWVRIHTNAKTLNAEKAKKLIESGLSEIRFSFDTADKEIYNKLRVRSDFDVVLKNIHEFIRIKQELGAGNPVVNLQEMIPYQPGKAACNTDKYKALFKGCDVNFTARHLHNFAGASKEKEFATHESTGSSPCRQLYKRLVVTFDGKIHACCLDAEGFNIIGDLSKGDTIASSWNSEAMQRLRHLTYTHQLDGLKPCDSCDQLRQNRKPMSLKKRLLASILWKSAAGKKK